MFFSNNENHLMKAAEFKTIAVALMLLLIFAGDLYAQETDLPVRQRTKEQRLIDLKKGVAFEIAPYSGAMGGSGIFGLNASMNYSTINMEVSASQVIGKTANLYPISLNFVLNLATQGRLLPYGTVGGGLFITSPTNSIGSESVSTMGLNFGGGARFYLTRSFGFRLGVKQYVTNVTNQIESRDELLIFQEVSLGVTFMFR